MKGTYPYQIESVLIQLFPFTKEEKKTASKDAEPGEQEFLEMNSVLDEAERMINEHTPLRELVAFALNLTVGEILTTRGHFHKRSMEFMRDLLKEIRFGTNPAEVIAEGEQILLLEYRG